MIGGSSRNLPDCVDAGTRSQAEAHLAQLAIGLVPTQLRQAADRLAYVLNQDGDAPRMASGPAPPPDTGQAGYRWDERITWTARPGGARDAGCGVGQVGGTWHVQSRRRNPMCRWRTRRVTAAPNDLRSPGQRNHDALKAMGRASSPLDSWGDTTDFRPRSSSPPRCKELESGAGQAVTAGGSLLPMRDLIRLASHAHHYLVVFDNHTQTPLYLGRSKRLASPGQRIVLHARDRGCTRPGCTAPGYWCQADHDDGWAARRAHDVDKTEPGLPAGQRPHRRRRMDDTQTPRRPHRMDPTPAPRHRPSPGE